MKNNSALSIEYCETYVTLINEAILKTEELYEWQQKTNQIEFLSIKDVCRILQISPKTAKKLFNDPEFPSEDYGKEKRIMASAFVDFFSVKRRKKYSSYWN